ncbi:HlyD family secretion protein [Aliifodinibius sp. S!AR15-10]|uniref:HlyD family secretion protein n=1 Tax=Aliifodinibius sp. S!AR15-10 TaxID=2950437 RepID=UPI002865AFED|nr:HlyD family efflux transporter periplasmic adaptor subunit [Aliifodinibius sp. S!AR15-10]MDR8389591.1 HlyD family secretion protein [Aliifodinibius sp. S!AR15-10]
MDRQLFPDEIVKNSAEANFKKHSVKTKIIYSSTVLFILAALSSLPLIYVDVSVRSQGVIKPITERNKLTSLVSGKIRNLYIGEDDSVGKGDKLAEIAAPLIEEKLLFNRRRQIKVKKYLNDLSQLSDFDSTKVYKSYNLLTPKYNHSFLQFTQQVRDAFQEINNIREKFNRDKKLYQRKVLSEAKFEQISFNLQSARNDLQLLIERQRNEWQADQIKYQDELQQLQSEAEQLKKEQSQHLIKAPISGTIQNMQGIYEGSFVSPNQVLAEISPDTGLIAECYVKPKDIGLLKEGMEARFQISAYDFNQWGIITGEISEISNDVTVLNNQSVFIVKSRLDKTYLELESGYRGSLKKGMTMQARFTVTRRSLFQLLYENVNDWLNPNWNQKGQTEEKQQASL